ncbi:MAG TPA: hypothetical protein VK771_08480, partial [Acidimicrobiia bacterium]|nr:hypothetical protein [Acidimicrobiia bacterium]
TRVVVAASVGATALFSALAAWAQPGHSKTARRAASGPQVLSPRVTGAGATIATPAVTDPTAPTTTVRGDQTAGSQGGAGAQQLSPPTTVPAPTSETTSPPPVVVSGAS